MSEKYYIDSCIWRDYFENRSDKFRPLGEWAFTLLKKIIQDNNLIIYSDLVEEELQITYSEKEIKNIFSIIPNKILIKVETSAKQLKEAIKLSKEFNIPTKDALHVILARDNNSILITRDKHFYEIEKQITIRKPEELI
jgi:predicted nucleic acid-binding protein